MNNENTIKPMRKINGVLSMVHDDEELSLSKQNGSKGQGNGNMSMVQGNVSKEPPIMGLLSSDKVTVSSEVKASTHL